MGDSFRRVRYRVRLLRLRHHHDHGQWRLNRFPALYMWHELLLLQAGNGVSVAVLSCWDLSMPCNLICISWVSFDSQSVGVFDSDVFSCRTQEAVDLEGLL